MIKKEKVRIKDAKKPSEKKKKGKKQFKKYKIK